MIHFISKLVKLTKIEHTIFSIPLLFAGAFLASEKPIPQISVLLLILLAGLGARILGIAMNRILDRTIDGQNPRTQKRELVTGEVSVFQAATIAILGLFVYLLACVLLNPLVLKLSPIPALVLILYSLLKRFTPLCHFGIGLSLALAPGGAYLAVTGKFAVPTDLLLLCGFTFFWISGFDIIYALQDLAFDKKYGIYSIPAAYGSKGGQLIAAGCHLVAVLLLFLLMLVRAQNLWVIIPFGFTLISFISAYLPFIPLTKRFFPTSAIAGVGGALIPFF